MRRMGTAAELALGLAQRRRENRHRKHDEGLDTGRHRERGGYKRDKRIRIKRHRDSIHGQQNQKGECTKSVRQ